jgi:hypothetical protein
MLLSKPEASERAHREFLEAGAEYSSMAGRAERRNRVWSSAFTVGSHPFVQGRQLGVRGLRCDTMTGAD